MNVMVIVTVFLKETDDEAAANKTILWAIAFCLVKSPYLAIRRASSHPVIRGHPCSTTLYP